MCNIKTELKPQFFGLKCGCVCLYNINTRNIIFEKLLNVYFANCFFLEKIIFERVFKNLCNKIKKYLADIAHINDDK